LSTPIVGQRSRGQVSPVLPRIADTIWTQADSERDKIYSFIESFCHANQIEAKLLKSYDLSGNVIVEYEAWQPLDANSADRCQIHIEIEPKPYHEHPLEYRLRVQLGGTEKIYSRVSGLDDATLLGILRATVDTSIKRLHPRPSRFREFPWQIWRPKNRIVGMDSKWLQPFVVIHWASWIGLGGALLQEDGSRIYLAVAILFGQWLLRQRFRKRVRYLSTGRPLTDPRRLVEWDRWQTVVESLGPEAATLAGEIGMALDSGINHGFTWQRERIWYWTAEGKIEREQMVVRYQRAIGFISIHAYGPDLYVGWDVHLNRGNWAEVAVGQGQREGNAVILKSVAPGTFSLNHYDSADANCLSEWMHASVVKVIKRNIAFHRIDQEIDFKIIRGNRALPTESKTEGGKKRLFSRLG
jgi:hypothetical protein